ncbi:MULTISPECIES: bifunctional 4-hydroxy-2-oxoglutarate aldolase/2-dehydro-3-deoxy-phosphogluconate aldolase [Prauserella salsuginis group]|uniref:Bifunctional 4-hydroxy-2-oxoglutarate aldolase/2-dehydro-3-deoxy-phosphogluconate aldolase n=1 Tax=Prauserella salsuginis TaxID=387889 RepID=A0ABW6G3V2_9PSEU|nr:MULTISPECIES: bifunctional 4-hydroxy-2-oxoglutarate aldolase/2-dehydro-3-deoxy-phosphogluconate aldolase [Prauserella salsuginis group]MCR3718379.1 2-dehydro-3-deoxyphosphogluconate aldolase / (4S)-4-hydroxy-2-oxoglutarate aldolase [Prauserella flava]MCR3732949.1 2-dehydro-3-deoxyphosphogluconate aldolase / (4S)-4-hydroxy-2-oxoglutarate aldolase [Prauserella salsuginis]
MADDVLRQVRQHRAMVIYRGQSIRECLDLTALLRDEGIRLFEVTLNSDEPFAAIRALRDEYGDGLALGAGTVMTADDVSRAAEAGARFVVSPHVDEAVIERAKELGLGAVPGAFTPTEVVQAVRLGADVVKVFPIAPVGVGHLRQLKGPLPDVPMLATGGVGPDLARACLDEGCAGVGVGVQLLGVPGDPDTVRTQARRLVEAVS